MSQEGIPKVYSLTMPVRAQNTDQLLRAQYNPASEGHGSSGNKANARPAKFFFWDALKLLFRIMFCSKLTRIDNSDESFFSCKWHSSGKLGGNEVRRCPAQRYRTIYAIPGGLMVNVCFELWIYSWTIHNANFKETLLPWRSLHFLLALILLYYPVLIFRFKYMTMPCQYLYIVDILRNFYICGTFFFSLLLIGSSLFLCLSKIDWLKITHFYVSYAVFLILMALFLLLIMRNVGISCEISFLSRQIPGETGHLCPFELVPFVENGEILLYKPTESGWQIQRFAKEAEPKSLYSGWDRYFYPLDTARPNYPNSRITEKDHKKILCILVLLFIAYMLHTEDDQLSSEVGNERTKRCAFTNFLSQLFGLGGGTGTGVPPINVGSTGGSGLGFSGNSGLGLSGGSGFGFTGGSAFGLTGGSGNGIPPLNVGGSGVGLDRTSNFESGGGGSAVFIDRRFHESSRRAKIRRGHRVEDAYDESESHMD